MGIEYLDGGRITGLSTDAKPDRDTSDTTSPALTIQAGSVFIETDTGARYVHNGTAWIQQTFDSLNSAFGRSGGVPQRQHFVEWFTGKGLNTNIWGVATDTGGSVAMSDEINGGVTLTTTSTAYSRSGIGWCPDHTGTDQYMSPLLFSPTGSAIHVVTRVAGSVSYANASGFGFMEKFSDGSGRNTACMMLGAVGYFRLRTCNSSGTQTSPDTDVSTADRFTSHLWTTECKPSSVDLSCNDVFKATSTTNLPSSSVGLAPCCGVQNSNAGNVTINHINYIEAYNH